MGDFLAYLIVAGAVLYWLKRLKVHLHLSKALSEFLLKRGQVKWAFRVRDVFEPRKKTPGSNSDCH